MVRYRRCRVAGGTYFFTVTLHDRGASTLVDHIDTLREVLRAAVRARPFVVDAMVVLPEHLHAVWTLPPGDDDYAGRWWVVKSRFTRSLAKAGRVRPRNAKGEYDLWQRRYWEHTVRDEADLARHVDYIHYNPVKHGWVDRVCDWPHSSFHRFVARGDYLEDWGEGGVGRDKGVHGE